MVDMCKGPEVVSCMAPHRSSHEPDRLTDPPPEERPPKDLRTTRDNSDSNVVKKSYSFQNFLYGENLLGPGKKKNLGPPSASLCPAHSHLRQRKLASPTGTFVWRGGSEWGGWQR